MALLWFYANFHCSLTKEVSWPSPFEPTMRVVRKVREVKGLTLGIVLVSEGGTTFIIGRSQHVCVILCWLH